MKKESGLWKLEAVRLGSCCKPRRAMSFVRYESLRKMRRLARRLGILSQVLLHAYERVQDLTRVDDNVTTPMFLMRPYLLSSVH